MLILRHISVRVGQKRLDFQLRIKSKESTHERHIHMAGDTNNNQMESFNGNTARLREEATRGLKREDSAILTGLRLYHNFVRPHLGLDWKTPTEVAEIFVEGDNKWKTLIRAAAKSAA